MPALHESALDPRVEPVLLLQGRPAARFQLLGAVEAKGKSKRSAGNGLAIRAAMMGADAVVDLNAERLAGFIRTEHRASGMAVRSVDHEGRLELKRRWFSGQIDHMRLPILAVAFLGLLGGLVGSFMYILMYSSLERVSSDLWLPGQQAAWIGLWVAMVTLVLCGGHGGLAMAATGAADGAVLARDGGRVRPGHFQRVHDDPGDRPHRTRLHVEGRVSARVVVAHRLFQFCSDRRRGRLPVFAR